MAKMAVSVCLLALSLYAAWALKLGDRTLKEHLVRIAKTPEVHDLGLGIASTVGAAKSSVKTKIASRLHATREGGEGREPPPDVADMADLPDPDDTDVRR